MLARPIANFEHFKSFVIDSTFFDLLTTKFIIKLDLENIPNINTLQTNYIWFHVLKLSENK